MASNLSTQILLKGVQPIETFTGADDQDPTTWLQGIDELFDATKIDKNDRRRLLPMYFGEDVKKWYRSEEHSSDYETFKEQFINTFTSSGYKLKIYSKIVNRRQRPDEAVQSYHYDIISLCAKLNPDMLENEKILHLLRGLKPSILQQVIMADPKTCRDLLEQAKRAEAAAAIIQPRAIITSTTTEESIEETTAALRRTTVNNNNNQQFDKPNWNSQQQSNYNQRWSQPQYNNNQQFDEPNWNSQQQPNYNQRWSQQKYNNNQYRRPQRGASSQILCYNCNGMGHYAYQCPSHLN